MSSPSTRIPQLCTYTRRMRTAPSARRRLTPFRATASWVVGSRSPTSPATAAPTSPSDFATGVASAMAPTIRFARALDAASVSGATVSLQNGDTGAVIPATVSYDSATQTITIRPSAALASGPYIVTLSGVKDGAGNVMEAPYSFRFTTGSAADVYPPETMIWQGSTGTMS